MISAVLARREIALLDGAGIPEATISFKEKLCAFPSAQSTFRIAISSQFSFSFFYATHANSRLTINDCRLEFDSIGNCQSQIILCAVSVDGIRCAEWV